MLETIASGCSLFQSDHWLYIHSQVIRIACNNAIMIIMINDYKLKPIWCVCIKNCSIFWQKKIMSCLTFWYERDLFGHYLQSVDIMSWNNINFLPIEHIIGITIYFFSLSLQLSTILSLERTRVLSCVTHPRRHSRLSWNCQQELLYTHASQHGGKKEQYLCI